MLKVASFKNGSTTMACYRSWLGVYGHSLFVTGFESQPYISVRLALKPQYRQVRKQSHVEHNGIPRGGVPRLVFMRNARWQHITPRLHHRVKQGFQRCVQHPPGYAKPASVTVWKLLHDFSTCLQRSQAQRLVGILRQRGVFSDTNQCPGAFLRGKKPGGVLRAVIASRGQRHG